MKKLMITLLIVISCLFCFSKSYIVYTKGNVYKTNGAEKIKLEKEVELDEEDEIEVSPTSSVTIVTGREKIKINYGKGKIKDFVSSN